MSRALAIAAAILAFPLAAKAQGGLPSGGGIVPIPGPQGPPGVSACGTGSLDANCHVLPGSGLITNSDGSIGLAAPLVKQFIHSTDPSTVGDSITQMSDGTSADVGPANTAGIVSGMTAAASASPIVMPPGMQKLQITGSGTLASQVVQVPVAPRDGTQVNVSVGAGLTITNLIIEDTNGSVILTGQVGSLQQDNAWFKGGAWSGLTAPIAAVVGPAGPQGVAGATGAQGPIGNTGATGPAGATGAAGPVGAAGSAGAVGAQGPAGVAGPAGAIGPTGATGAAGPVGATGAAGTNAQGFTSCTTASAVLITTPAVSIASIGLLPSQDITVTGVLLGDRVFASFASAPPTGLTVLYPMAVAAGKVRIVPATTALITLGAQTLSLNLKSCR